MTDFCLRCGREGHVSEDCPRPLPPEGSRCASIYGCEHVAACGERGACLAPAATVALAHCNGPGPSSPPPDTGRNERENRLLRGSCKGVVW